LLSSGWNLAYFLRMKSSRILSYLVVFLVGLEAIAQESTIPKDANSNDLDLNVGQANSSAIEFEKPIQLAKRSGKIRVLGFYTQARMGNYNLSVQINPAAPDFTSTRIYSRSKYGFGINLEQEIGKGVGVFARASWND